MNDLKCIKQDRTPGFNGLSMGFNVSFKLTNISKIWTVCWFLRTGNKFPDISVNFKGEKMVDQILEIPRLFLVLKVLTVILLNYIYEIIPLGTKTT